MAKGNWAPPHEGCEFGGRWYAVRFGPGCTAVGSVGLGCSGCGALLTFEQARRDPQLRDRLEEDRRRARPFGDAALRAA